MIRASGKFRSRYVRLMAKYFVQNRIADVYNKTFPIREAGVCACGVVIAVFCAVCGGVLPVVINIPV